MAKSKDTAVVDYNPLKEARRAKEIKRLRKEQKIAEDGEGALEAELLDLLHGLGLTVDATYDLVEALKLLEAGKKASHGIGAKYIFPVVVGDIEVKIEVKFREKHLDQDLKNTV